MSVKMRKYGTQPDWQMNFIQQVNDVNIESQSGNKLVNKDGRKFYDLWNDTTCSVGWELPRKWMKEFLDSGVPHQQPKVYKNSVVDVCSAVLTKALGYSRVFYSSSGSMAVETAIKLARKYFHELGKKEKKAIVSLPYNFHGRTLGTLALNDCYNYGAPYHQQGFRPTIEEDGLLGPWLPGHFVLNPHYLKGQFADYGEFNDWMIDWFDTGPHSPGREGTAAIITAPVNGHNNVFEYGNEKLLWTKRWCEENDILLIFDEVQTGFGLIGDFCYAQYSRREYGIEVKPDILVTGKRMAAGFPMAATFCDQKHDSFEPGSHFDTFAGSPFVCFMALQMYDWLEDNMWSIREKSKYAAGELSKKEYVKEVRRVGAMIAFELKSEFCTSAAFNAACKVRGILWPQFRENGPIRFQPPFTITKNDIDTIMCIFDGAINAIKSPVEWTGI